MVQEEGNKDRLKRSREERFGTERGDNDQWDQVDRSRYQDESESRNVRRRPDGVRGRGSSRYAAVTEEIAAEEMPRRDPPEEDPTNLLKLREALSEQGNREVTCPFLRCLIPVLGCRSRAFGIL
eukprot:758684-Hanusia_phi.AAC.4